MNICILYPSFATGKNQYYQNPTMTTVGTVIGKMEEVMNESASPSNEELQVLRDEVRMMVASGKPAAGIPLYQGRLKDGDPVVFLKEHYRRYLPGSGNDTLFMHELRILDRVLAQALSNAARGPDKLLPIGTKSDLINALAQGIFFDISPKLSQERASEARRKRLDVRHF